MENKLIIFDLDGTIVDTLDDLNDAINYVLISCGLNTQTKDKTRSYIGNGIRKLIELSLGEENKEKTDDAYTYFISYYENHCLDNSKPYQNVIQTLLRLKIKGFKLAVCTNKFEKVAKLICDSLFNGIFDYVLGQNDKIARKPSAEPIQKIMSELNCNNDNVILVGDSNVDYQTALNSNVKCILVSYGYGQNLPIKNVPIIDTFDKLLELLIN